jgi:hypothetical protein
MPGPETYFSSLSFDGMDLCRPGVNSDAAKLQHSYEVLQWKRVRKGSLAAKVARGSIRIRRDSLRFLIL